jgi:hypothetical protein
MKFVRQLQNALQEQGAADMNLLQSQELKQEYEREQAVHAQLDEQVTRAQQEQMQLQERLQLFCGDKQIVVTE